MLLDDLLAFRQGGGPLATLSESEVAELAACLDTLSARYGRASLLERISPSFFDALLHRMNPRHNDAYESYIYRMDTP